MNPNDIHNLRNRIDAAKANQNYNQRMFIDVPVQMAERLLVINDLLGAEMKTVAELREQVAHWKSNHDNQVAIKAAILDRPDLQERATLVAALIARTEKAERERDAAKTWLKIKCSERDAMQVENESLAARVKDLESYKTSADEVLSRTADLARKYCQEFNVGKLGDFYSEIVINDARKLRSQIAGLVAYAPPGHALHSCGGQQEACMQPGCTECGMPTMVEALSMRAQIDSLPADWRTDSSLEKWFPLTAEELTRLRAQIASPLRSLAAQVLAINTANGWNVTKPEEWADTYKIPAILALIHSEVSEALEDFRKDNRQHFEEEIADVVIRCLDLCGGMVIDLDAAIAAKLEKNKARGLRHGGKKV